MEEVPGRVDRRARFQLLNQLLVVDPRRSAVITIDVQRGALDPEHATMPIEPQEAQRLLASLARALRMARARGMPVVHVLTSWYPVELARHPFEQAMAESRQSFSPHAQTHYHRHKLVGSPGAELMHGLQEPSDYLITSKRTFDMFHGTNLEGLLRALGVDTLILTGVNTNTCVQCSAFAAYNRGYRVVVLSDATASTYGQDLHQFALENVACRLGWVLTVDELAAKLAGQEAAAPSGMRVSS